MGMKTFEYNILDKILTEGRLADTIKKYVGTDPELTEEVVRELFAADPSGNNKYLDWMCSQRKKYTSQSIIDTVKCFHENVSRLSEKNINTIYASVHLDEIEKVKKAPKDINSYESIESIQPICTYFEEQKPKTASRVKIYEDDKWLVVSPLTHSASCQYGTHSNWCVSTSNVSYYERYTKEGILVFFIDKKGKNIEKPGVNVYKIAVNIRFDSPDIRDWEWYTMEDTRVESSLMVSLLPKNLLEVTMKYLDEFLSELSKKYSIDEKELQEKSLCATKSGTVIHLFVDLKDFNLSSVEKSVEFLRKFDTENNYTPDFDIVEDKNTGLRYFNITLGSEPSIVTSLIRWAMVNEFINPDNKTISLSNITEVIADHSVVRKFSPEDINKIIDLYVRLFNQLDYSISSLVRTENLKVGDVILYTGQSRYSKGEKVRVISVADKSIQLSNGKRMVRSYTNYKTKYSSVLRIVDDKKPTVESKWTKKRII